MSFCKQCGAQIPDDANFCTSCGADQREETAPAAQPVAQPTPAPAAQPAPAPAPQPIPTPTQPQQPAQPVGAPQPVQPQQPGAPMPGAPMPGQPVPMPPNPQMPNGMPQGQPGFAAGQNPNDSGHIGWGILGALFPLVGFILFIIWHNSKPKCAKVALTGAIIGFVINLLFSAFMVPVTSSISTGASYF